MKDDESVISLFELLSQFENCSGLRINESKSELLWLGSGEEPILAFGIYFSYDDKLAAQKNFLTN